MLFALEGNVVPGQPGTTQATVLVRVWPLLEAQKRSGLRYIFPHPGIIKNTQSHTNSFTNLTDGIATPKISHDGKQSR